MVERNRSTDEQAKALLKLAEARSSYELALKGLAEQAIKATAHFTAVADEATEAGVDQTAVRLLTGSVAGLEMRFMETLGRGLSS